jgi:mannitol-specific phosphotransferase system IIBC component
MKDRQQRTGLITPQMANGTTLPMVSPQPLNVMLQNSAVLAQAQNGQIGQITPEQVARQVSQVTQQQLAMLQQQSQQQQQHQQAQQTQVQQLQQQQQQQQTQQQQASIPPTQRAASSGAPNNVPREPAFQSFDESGLLKHVNVVIARMRDPSVRYSTRRS